MKRLLIFSIGVLVVGVLFYPVMDLMKREYFFTPGVMDHLYPLGNRLILSGIALVAFSLYKSQPKQ